MTRISKLTIVRLTSTRLTTNLREPPSSSTRSNNMSLKLATTLNWTMSTLSSLVLISRHRMELHQPWLACQRLEWRGTCAHQQARRENWHRICEEVSHDITPEGRILPALSAAFTPFYKHKQKLGGEQVTNEMVDMFLHVYVEHSRGDVARSTSVRAILHDSSSPKEFPCCLVHNCVEESLL